MKKEECSDVYFEGYKLSFVSVFVVVLCYDAVRVNKKSMHRHAFRVGYVHA